MKSCSAKKDNLPHAVVLIIDDDEDVLATLKRFLSFSGYRVLSANNGIAGLELAFEHHPDLILCDVLMPKMNGLEILQMIRSKPETENVPFLFLTARSDEEEIREAMELGADDFLCKPIAPQALLKAVQKRIERYKKNRHLGSQAVALQKAVFSRLPHELVNSLSGVMAFSELLSNESLSPRAGELVRDIQKSGQRLERLLKKYLLFCEIELLKSSAEGGVDGLCERTPGAAEVIDRTARRVVKEYGREADLKTRLEKIALGVSERMIERLVLELVENACIYSPAKTPILLQLHLEDSSAILSLKDEGAGFSSAEVEEIGPFIKFARKEALQSGLGLGLYLLKHLAERDRGSFVIEPQTKGTLFTLKFPLGQSSF